MIDDDGTMHERADTGGAPGPGLPAARRNAIFYAFESIHGNPPESEWDGRGGTVPMLLRWLRVGQDSARVVRRTLEDIVDAQGRGVQYDGSKVAAGRGRPALIKMGSAEAKGIFEALRTGVGVPQATVLVNIAREQQGLPSVSYSAVQSFVSSHPDARIVKRPMKKSGKEDMDSVWAQARKAFALQLRDQLKGIGPHASIYLDGIAWWDEHHKKVRLGHAGKYMFQEAEDPDRPGERMAIADGGAFPELKTARGAVTTAKYLGEARFCFGAAMRTVTGADGVEYAEGVRLEPFE
jgi:hypothetical protein